MKHFRLSDEALMAILIASILVLAGAGIVFWFHFTADVVISAVAFVTEYRLPIPWPFLIVLGSVLLSYKESGSGQVAAGDEAKKLVMGEIPLSSLIRKRKVTIDGETCIPDEYGELDEIVGEDGDYPEELDTSDIQGKAISLVTPNPSYEKERRMER